jgi:DNA-binding MarR family transcriptional regulator
MDDGLPLAQSAGLITTSLAKLSRTMRALELPMELTYERLSALGTIQSAEPLSLSQLADIEKITRGTISRIVVGLERQGLVKRLPDKSDGRGVLLRTTAKGRQVFQRAIEHSMTQILDAIGSMQARELEALRILCENLKKRAE